MPTITTQENARQVASPVLLLLLLGLMLACNRGSKIKVSMRAAPAPAVEQAPGKPLRATGQAISAKGSAGDRVYVQTGGTVRKTLRGADIREGDQVSLVNASTHQTILERLTVTSTPLAVEPGATAPQPESSGFWLVKPDELLVLLYLWDPATMQKMAYGANQLQLVIHDDPDVVVEQFDIHIMDFPHVAARGLAPVRDQAEGSPASARAELGQGWLSPSFSATDRVELMGSPLDVIYR